MAAVIDPPRDPRAAVTIPPARVGSPGVSDETNASIQAYLGAGDGMARIMSLTMMMCAALLVLIALAWVLGALPGAVRLF